MASVVSIKIYTRHRASERTCTAAHISLRMFYVQRNPVLMAKGPEVPQYPHVSERSICTRMYCNRLKSLYCDRPPHVPDCMFFF